MCPARAMTKRSAGSLHRTRRIITHSTCPDLRRTNPTCLTCCLATCSSSSTYPSSWCSSTSSCSSSSRCNAMSSIGYRSTLWVRGVALGWYVYSRPRRDRTRDRTMCAAAQSKQMRFELHPRHGAPMRDLGDVHEPRPVQGRPRARRRRAHRGSRERLRRAHKLEDPRASPSLPSHYL